MKLSKKVEAEVLEIYIMYWDAYLKGDMETFGKYLDPGISVFGTSEHERYFNKKDALTYFSETANQITGQLEMRNPVRQIEAIGNEVLITEYGEMFVLSCADWILYSPYRLSSMFRKDEEGWKLFHQHGSFPDMRTSDGEQIAIERMTEENLVLKEAVKQRTKELEDKNQALLIEVALEKIRSRSLTVTTSEEFVEVVKIVFEQLTELRIPVTAVSINIDLPGSNHSHVYACGNSDAGLVISEFQLNYFDHPIAKDILNARRSGAGFFTRSYDSNDTCSYYEYQFEHTSLGQLPPESRQLILQSKRYTISIAGGVHTAILLNDFNGAILDYHERDVLKKFNHVFEQAYIRFQDILKAESLARESQVELSLQRIRALVTSMKESAELLDIVVSMRSEFVSLGHEAHYFWHMRWLPELYEKAMTSGDGSRIGMVMTLPRSIHGEIKTVADWEQTNDPYIVLAMDGEAAVDYVHKMVTLGDFEVVDHNAPTLDDIRDIGGLTFIMVRTSHGEIGFSLPGYVPSPSKEAIDTLIRFASVFDLAYKRFEDLTSREKQHREAQVELALERVRAKTMAMQESEELAEASLLLVQQVEGLGIPTWGCAFHIYDEHDESALEWFSNSEISLPPYTLPRENVFLSYYEAGLRGERLYIQEFSGQRCIDHYEYLCTLPGVGDSLKEMKAAGVPFPERQTDHVAFFKYGYLLFITLDPCPAGHEIFLRFAKVFEQTYTRYLDLQKAEAQAKEAKIEASLERIRAKAMAMHHSDELDEVLAVLFEQFDVLGINPLSTHMTLIDLPSNTFTFRETGKAGRRSFGEQVVAIDSMDIWKEAADKWKNSEPLTLNSLHFPKESLPMVWQVFQESFASMPDDAKLYPEDYPDGIYHTAGNCVFGYIGMNQTRPATVEEEQIVLKFATEFGRFYQRYLDLQKAEAQVRDAQIETSLERVRAKAMAMHSSEDLAGTIAAFYSELELYSITPRRCGVGLLNRETRIAELSTMNTAGQGKSLEIIGKVKLEGHPVLEGIYSNWIDGKEYHPILRGKEITRYNQLLMPQVNFPDYPKDEVQFGYFFFFPEGGVYTWTNVELKEEELKIYRRFTSVLSLTYQRYKDLQQAEELALQAEKDLVNLKAEKKKTEDALAELKIMQSQLIQSEKMASLGELTAGIAHEIQNPLNFVNNFSEVSNELMEEMLEELSGGDYDEVRAIVEDLRQNMGKINHHGKRADGIVKGMLQHSRSSSGQPEPTDINALADEYLRLAYHGLRARDKTFNATLQTDYDASIGIVNIIPQDIGRVILNLITNAFYVVDEKKKSGIENYEPTISISTRSKNDEVLILVKDNANGIPANVLDKIFQPFFTTKPTGQGTGLGLSLSYDVVKAHGGDLSVTTKETIGSEFTIRLPKN